MIEVKLIEKIKKGPKDENFERKLKDTKKFDKPESYNNFISIISNHFKIPQKSIELICLTNDGDEIGINNDEDLNENLGEAKEFNVYSESGNEEKPSKDNPSSEKNNSSKKNGSKDDDQKDEDEYKIKLDLNIDIKDNEIEEIINKQIKDIKIDDKDDNLNYKIEFDKDKYKDKLETQTKNYISDFKKKFDLTIKKVYDEKAQIQKSIIENIMDNQNKTRIDFIKKVNNNISSLKNEYSETLNQTNEMEKHLGELKDNLEKNPNKKIYENIEKSNNRNNAHYPYENNIVFDRNDDGDKDNDDDNYNDDENDDDDDDDYNKLKVKFFRQVIKNEEFDTNCTSIIINNIKIENIGNKTLDKLYFIRDEKNSSNEFIISQSTNINCCQLNSTGDKFVPGKIQNHSIALEIKKPIVGQTYYLKLYIRENKNGKNISKPLEIFYTIKEDEEAAIRKIEEQEKEEEDVKRRKEEEEEKRRKEE